VYGCILSTNKPRGLQRRGGEGYLASLDWLLLHVCFQLMPAQEQLLFSFNSCMFCCQFSSYSIVLLAVAETRAPAPMRHQPEDKRP
jgi:hypothetical protein